MSPRLPTTHQPNDSFSLIWANAVAMAEETRMDLLVQDDLHYPCVTASHNRLQNLPPASFTDDAEIDLPLVKIIPGTTPIAQAEGGRHPNGCAGQQRRG